jgi:murein DD-endopeptidase MepM/ murein hydrolase activator NlpD
VLRRFERPPAPWAAGHRGVDLGGTPGESVFAAADGVVIYAGQLADRPLVSIAHPSGLHSTYEPVAPTVQVGQRVSRGDPIGHLQPGHPHCTAAACLHWGLRRGEEYLDPLTLVTPHRIRLLPWQDHLT